MPYFQSLYLFCTSNKHVVDHTLISTGLNDPIYIDFESTHDYKIQTNLAVLNRPICCISFCICMGVRKY